MIEKRLGKGKKISYRVRWRLGGSAYGAWHMLTVFVGAGLRNAELAALQVRDIEAFAKSLPTLPVRRAWKRQADNTSKLGPPKTKQSRQAIALSPMVMVAIPPNIAGKHPEEFVLKSPTGSWCEKPEAEVPWICGAPCRGHCGTGTMVSALPR